MRYAPSTIRLAIAVAVVGLSLAACGSVPAEPKIVTRDVVLPQAVSCIPASLEPEPDYPVDVIGILAMAGPERYQAVTALMLLYRARLGQLEPTLALCRTPPAATEAPR